jgi:large subunit ribosomal protein L11
VQQKLGEKKQVEALLSGGEVNAGPPLGPALGPLGVNVLQIVNRINELTKAYSGMKVPVRVVVDVETKEFEVDIGTPTTSALVVKELGIQKGSGNPKAEKVGNLTMDQVAKIASMKLPSSYSKSTKAAAKEVMGTCVSLGITIDGRDPREVQKELDQGKWDQVFQKAS